ncbi:MAG: outer-membrane lipoprotein carrier protein LolA [Prevotella sp.]|nr:outer-membrane lipoprotein carrier protein LolA [Prevotella sp.]
MKKTLMITIALIFTMGMHAQNAEQARKILDKTAATVSNKGGASASFTMNGKYGNTSGTINIKGNKFCAYTPQAIIWYDGKTQWTYNKSADEVNVSTPTQAQQQSLNPYTFINLYKNGFNMTSKAVGGGSNQVHLTAQNQKSGIQEMYITIDKNYHPTQVKMRTSKGWSTISISNFKAKKLSDAAFKFNAKAYPNAEIIDLR